MGLLLAVGIASGQVQIQVGVPQVAEEDPYSVYLPTDRTLSRGMARAEERLGEGEFNEALAFLQQVLDQEEDTFLDAADDAASRRGLKATARRLIASLPAAGREMYELLHATAARRQLEAAIASGDRERLASLVRRYLFTPSGYDAALILAQTEFDRGHPLAAAYIYQQLAEDPLAAKQFQPQLSLLAAVSWSAAGLNDRAAAALRSLAAQSPEATIDVAGRRTRLPDPRDPDANLIAWLSKTVGDTKQHRSHQQDWLTLRGNAYRSAKSTGGAPHLSVRWQARVVNDPQFESFLSTRAEQFAQQGVVAIPAARPIAAGDFVLMRTPRNVVAVDWRSGKRIWETREDEFAPREGYLTDFNAGEPPEEWQVGVNPIEQRVWDETLTMSLVSDGEKVYALHGNAPGEREENIGWGMGVPFGGPFDMISAPTNRLTAYELATEGKLAWEIDGANDPGEFSGAYFLGPPLAVDGSLFVLAEIRSAIYLLALDSRSGSFLWKQQLAGLEQGITLDPQRRTTAATPSQAAGILVCPTTAGIIVAVDIIQREFAWVYRYPRQVESYANVRHGWQGRPDMTPARDNNRWLDGSVVIDDGRVFLTPPESDDLHCVDLNTGRLLWKRPREKSLFLACVDRGNVLLVGPESVTAIRAADGVEAWSPESIDLPADNLPSGIGYLSEGRYYLPLSSGHVIAIDTKTGATSGAIGTSSDVSVGNLICHRGSVISQSALVLDKYDQIEILRKRAEAALVENPRDATAIRDLAEMKHLDGALDEAVRMLKQAYEIDSSDPLTSEMFANCLLEALAADYTSHAHDLPLLRHIAKEPQQQIELLRLEAMGLEDAGKPMEAVAALMLLADATAAEPVSLAISPGHTVRSDAWIRTRISSLWADASPEERGAIEQQLADRRSEWPESASIHQMRSYLRQFDGLPGTDETRLQLVRQLLDERELLETEIELLKLERSTDPKYRAASAVLMVEWLLLGDRADEARRIADAMASQWPDAPLVDGKTPQQLLARWRSELTNDEAAGEWPRGRVAVDIEPVASSTRRGVTRRAFVEFQQGLRRLRIEQVYRHPPLVEALDEIGPPAKSVGAQLGAAQWLIAQDGARVVGRNGTGVEMFRFNPGREVATRGFPGNSDWVRAAQLGDLLYVTLGGQILALDTRQLGDDEADVVWRSFPGGRYASAPRAELLRGAMTRQRTQTLYHPWSERKRMPGPASLMTGGIGPVSPNRVVLEEHRQIRAVDPVTGSTLWSRTDIPAGCELFGDDELLFAANAAESEVYLINPDDGELVDRRAMPAAPWLLTSGRNVCQLTDANTSHGVRKTLRIVDIESGEELFNANYGPTARMTTLEPDYVAVVESPDRTALAQSVASTLLKVPEGRASATPAGRFELIDVRTGRRVIDQPLEGVPVPRAIHLLESEGQLFVVVSGDVRQGSSAKIGLEYPLADGCVYAFNLASGEPMWPGPAVVNRRGVCLAQPKDIPMLVFVDRYSKRDEGGGSSQLRLLCLDKETGATVYRNDSLPDTAGGIFRIRGARSEAQTVSIEMSARTVRLTFTDEPRAPEPPANDLVEAPRKSLGRGLWGVGERMGDVIQGAIRNPGGAGWRLAPGGAPQQAPPPDEAEPMDDD